ncbi:MAG: polysaccharide biosynthesis C-terminal domain-containing protein [Oscillospiraceae bacterium]|nr:polysaccharide biosynthesis C-terminal domain-containing protein [Oscillospiraceae bacterium]
MNKYKNLIFNTMILAVGTFGSKILAMFLTRLYTTYMGADILGTKELIETTANFLIPVFTLAISESVIRYGLDKDFDNKQVFSTAISVQFFGMIILTALSPLLSFIPFIKGYTSLLVVYVIVSALRQTTSLFIRSIGFMKLYALDGIIATLTLFLFNIFFISYLDMGLKGFMFSIIASDLFSFIFLFFTTKLWKNFSIKAVDKDITRTMMRFSIPMIPTSIMWIITGFSDRIFIKYLPGPDGEVGDTAAGLYTAASRIPNLVSMVSTVFFQAWNMSAISEYGSKGIGKFYEKVFDAYQSIMFIASAGIIVLVEPLSRLLLNYNVHPEYALAVNYTPVLVLSVLMMCFNMFLSSIYTAAEKTKHSFWTSLVVTVLNLILNVFLIRYYGVHGAVATTFVSYIVCYIIRIIDARRYIYFKVNHIYTAINIISLLALAVLQVNLDNSKNIYLILIGLFIIAVNFRPLITAVKSILSRRKG